MKDLHPDILDIIKALAAGRGKVLVRAAMAARMLDCSVKTFEKRYVHTGLLEQIYPLNCKHAHYNVFDIVRVPDLMKERDEFIKRNKDDNGSEPKSINQLLIETENIWKRGAA